MALENKKLSTYDDLLSSNIDTTTKLVVLTGATKVNANLPVTSFVEDSLTSSSVVKPLSAAKGKLLQDTKAPIANPTFTGTVGGVTKAMVGLSNVDNTSDAGKPISTAQAAGLAPKANPVFTGDISHGPSVYSFDGNFAGIAVNGESVILATIDPLDHSSDSMEFGDRTYANSSFKGLNVEIATGNVGGGGIGSGNITLKAKYTILTSVAQEFADNAAAIAGALAVGTIYRTGDILKIVHA